MTLPAGVRALTTASALILDVSAANGYELVSINMPERVWRRVVATSDDVEGNVEVQSVLDAATYEIVVRCKGANTGAVETLRSNLLTAFETRSWYLEVTIDGHTRTWKANRADSVTSTAEKMLLHAWMREVTLRVPVQPRPNEGAS